MTVVSAFDNKYRDMFNVSRHYSYLNTGYSVIGLNAPVNDDDFVMCGVQRCPYKAQVMIDAFENHVPLGDNLMWIDADAFLQKEPLEDFNGDVAVTVRPMSERRGGKFANFSDYVNSGVIYVKNNRNGWRFLHDWNEQIGKNEFGSDQGAINDLILPHSDMNERDVTVNCGDYRIHLLTTEEHNNYYFNDSTRNAHVVHFKGSRGSIAQIKKYFEKR